MLKNSDYLFEAKKIWNRISDSKRRDAKVVDPTAFEKLLGAFQVGDYFYNIFNIGEYKIEYTSEQVKSMLGIEPKDLTTELFFERIHPRDSSWVIRSEKRSVDFLKVLPSPRILNYRSRYDYRLKTKSNKFIRIMQQAMPIESRSDGTVTRSIAVFTDISHLKRFGASSLSMIGSNGEPSYIDIDSTKGFKLSKNNMTTREAEVLFLISTGMNTEDIAKKLTISGATVSNHRKSILKKTNSKTSAEVVAKAYEYGWI